MYVCECVCVGEIQLQIIAWHYVMCKPSSNVCVCVLRSLVRHHDVVNVLGVTHLQQAQQQPHVECFMTVSRRSRRRRRSRHTYDDDDDDDYWLRLNQTCWIAGCIRSFSLSWFNFKAASDPSRSFYYFRQSD